MGRAHRQMKQADIDFLLQSPSQWPVYSGYRPLNREGQEFRLLEIWRDTTSGDIHGAIQHARLDTSPPYKALSYCWGPPAKQKSIVIARELVSVRTTLWNFLDSICRDERGQLVWLDAICINQKDTEEREWQVKLMGKIYARAVKTIAWIGNDDDDSEYALRFLQRCTEPAIRNAENMHAIKKKAIEAAWNLIQRPYWRRLWVLQEIALSKRVIIACGSRRVSLDTLAVAVRHAGGHESLESVLEARLRIAQLASSCKGALMTAARHTISSSRTTQVAAPIPIEGTLLEMMGVFGDRLCGEPHDKIFALRSMATDRGKIEVSYTRGLGDLLFGVVQSFICHAISRDADGEASRLEMTSSLLDDVRKKLAAVLIRAQFGLTALITSMVEEQEMDDLTEICHLLSCTSPEASNQSVMQGSLLRRWPILFESSYDVLDCGLDSSNVTVRDPSDMEGYWYTLVVDNHCGEVFDDCHTGSITMDGAPELVIRYENDRPVIIGALSCARKCLLLIDVPYYRTVLWFNLLRAGEIQACRAIRCRSIPRKGYDSRDPRAVYQVAVHYSRLAVLSLSADSLDLNLLEEHRSRHPLQPLCRCTVNEAANTRRLCELRESSREHRVEFREYE